MIDALGRSDPLIQNILNQYQAVMSNPDLLEKLTYYQQIVLIDPQLNSLTEEQRQEFFSLIEIINMGSKIQQEIQARNLFMQQSQDIQYLQLL